MMVGYLCGKTDAKLCVVKQSIYVYIYMYDGGLSVKQTVYVCTRVHMGV